MGKKTKPLPRWAQYLLAFIYTGLAIGAGAASLAINVTYGLKSSLLMAAIFALSDVAKIVLPMTQAALGGWSIARRLTYGVAVILSVMAATSYLLETQASRLIEAQTSKASYDTAQADSTRIRAELATITETGDAVALASLASEAREKATREEGRGGCGKKCEAAKTKASQLLARLSAAKRREKLEDELASIRQNASTIKVAALGAADSLAALTGASRSQIATYESVIKSAFMLMALELIAALAGSAGTMITALRQAKPTKQCRKQMKQSEISNRIDEISPKISRGDYWLTRLSKEAPDIARQVIANEISCYQGCVQAGIRKAAGRSLKKDESALKSDVGFLQLTST